MPPERVRGKKRQATPPVKRRLSPRHSSWLFVTDQRALTLRICQTNADLQELYQLRQDVVQMVKQRMSHNSLDKNIHRDVYSVIIGILILAGLIALMLYIVNPIR